MSGSKREKRYNAFVKRTESGIIVKTVDSVTGVESIIKFTSDSIKLPGGSLLNYQSKENVKPVITNRPIEDKPYVNNKKKYYFPKSNPTLIKLNNLRPYLKELQPNIPDFDVYEDTSKSTVNFQNSNVIFVANSKFAKDGVFNLNIPGKLGNVEYHGVLSEDGFVKFKATSVIKPFTIVVGDYVINVNICHNLTSGTDSGNLDQLKKEEGSSLTNHDESYEKTPINSENSEINNGSNETDIDSKSNNNNYPQDCESQEDEDTAIKVNPSQEMLGGRNKTEESTHGINKKEKDKLAEISNSDSESVEKHYYDTEHDVTELYSHTKIIQTKNSSSEKLSIHENQLLGEKSSDNFTETKDKSLNIYKHHSHQNLKLSKSCLSPMSNTIPDGSKGFKMKQSSSSSHSIISGSDTQSSLGPTNLEMKKITKFDSSHTVTGGKDKVPNSKCSCISILEIKRRLTEATTSLYELCSVIESIESLSKIPVLRESNKEDKVKISSEDLDKINEILSKGTKSCPLPITMKNRLGQNNYYNDDNTNECFSGESYEFKNKSNVYQAGDCENDSGSQTIEKNAIDITNPRNHVTFQNLRQIQSLMNFSEEKETFVDYMYETKEASKITSNGVFEMEYKSNLPRRESQTGESANDFLAENKASYTIFRDDEVQAPEKFSNANLTSVSAEITDTTCMRSNQEHHCQTLSQNRITHGPRINSESSNSIKTLYIKSDCICSSNLGVPAHHSSMKMVNHNSDSSREAKTNDMSSSDLILIPSSKEKCSKNCFSRKIKQKVSRLKTQFWNFKTKTNIKEPDITFYNLDN